MNEIEQRRQKFAAMGIKLTEQASQAPVTASNVDVYNKIEQIRRGALKKDMKHLSDAPSAQATFQPLPTPKKRQDGNQKKSEYSVEPQSFTPKKPSEFSEIENMFDGGSGSRYSTSQDSYEQRPMSTNIEVDSFGPSFNPSDIRNQMQKRIKDKYGVDPQPDVRQLDSNIPPEYKRQIDAENEPVLNYYHIQKIIKEMIQDEVGTIVKKVLDEINGPKKQPSNVFEIVDTKKGLIKIKGNLYKLSKA